MTEPGNTRLPVLGNVKAPLKAEVLLSIIIDEAGKGVVVAASEHTRRCFLFLEFLDVIGLLIGVGRVAPNHFRVLGHADALALDDLNVVQAAENLVLDFESSAHGELGTLLDPEGLIFETVLASGGGEIDGDGIASSGIHGEGEDDADAGVVGVGYVFSITQAERLLVSLKRFVAGIHLLVLGQALLGLRELIALSLLRHGLVVVGGHVERGFGWEGGGPLSL